MPAILEIRDIKADGGLALGIRELLALIPAEGEELSWSVFHLDDFDITRKYALNQTARNLRTAVHRQEVVSWSQVKRYANTVFQTIWGTYIGCRDVAAFADLTALHGGKWLYLHQATPAYYEAIDIAFQAVDGGFWFAYAKSDAVIQRMTQTFRDVKTHKSW